MSTASILGDGCKIGYETGSPLAFALIPELNNLSDFPLPVFDKLENTKHGSGGAHTYGFGLYNIPDFNTEHYFDPATATFQAMIAAHAAGTLMNIRVEVPDSTGTSYMAAEMSARVMCKLSPPKDNWQMLTLTWVFCGDYALTATPAATQIT